MGGPQTHDHSVSTRRWVTGWVQKGTFGFERTQEISRQSGRSIAQAAQAFGQEDDITVLRLEYDGAAIASAPAS